MCFFVVKYFKKSAQLRSTKNTLLKDVEADIYVPEPDRLYEEFAARDVYFVLPLCDNSDDLRGFEVRDINGYVIYFGRPN